MFYKESFRNNINTNHDNCDMILKEKQQKYQHHHPEKFINMNILQAKKLYFLVKVE